MHWTVRPHQTQSCFSDMNKTAPDTIFNATARGCSAQVLTELMAQPNFNINETNTAGLTCLKAAIINGDRTHVLAVLDAGANISDDIIDFAKRCYPHKTHIERILLCTKTSRAAREVSSTF
jgi:hypothetical protein